jgi:hypothetical protein
MTRVWFSKDQRSNLVALKFLEAESRVKSGKFGGNQRDLHVPIKAF